MAWGSGNIGGGGSGAWAMVMVNYPSGSTLTATNVSGKKDISATQRLYYVKKPSSGSTQTCVFTITDGTQTKTQTVSGITIASAQTITLSYQFIIYDSGTEGIPIVINKGSSGSVTKDSSYITINQFNESQDAKAVIYSTTLIDTTPYNTFNVEIEYTLRTNGYSTLNVGLATDTNLNRDGFVAEHTRTATGQSYARHTYSVSIENINGEYYFKLFEMICMGYVYKVWLE